MGNDHAMVARYLALAVLCAALADCAVTADYHPPAVDIAARWSEAPESTTSAAHSRASWWTTFKDPELDSLVERAIRGNLDLRLAEARVREARARYAAVASSRWPSVNGTASISREKESANAPAPVLVTPEGQVESAGQPENIFQAGFDATWELDVFGARRRANEAAQAELESLLYDRGAVVLTLLAEVARNYIELRGSQRQSALAQSGLAAARVTVDLVRSRYDAGLASELNLARAQAQVLVMASRLPPLEASCKESLHRLGILLGLPPDGLADELLHTRSLPVTPAELPLGLPSDLLRQRPDIRRAERRMAAASARLGVATADLYPKFSLIATAGLASIATNDFFSSASTLWSAGTSMTWPIYRGGRIVATIKVREAQQQQALLAYRQAILTGLEDVENAIVAYTRERTRRGDLSKAVDWSRRVADLAGERYASGLTDFRNVLDAQRHLFQAQGELARSDTAVAVDLIALYKALGGGWDAVTPPSGIPPEPRAAPK